MGKCTSRHVFSYGRLLPYIEFLVADFCAQHRCQNGASCVSGDLKYTCLCNSGWTGTYCHLSMNGKHACLSIGCEQFK